LTFDIIAFSYVHKQFLSVVRTSAWFFVCFSIWRLTCIAFLPLVLHCSGVLYYICNRIYISYNVPFVFILIHLAFHIRWSCVFQRRNLVLRFPVLPFPPMRFGPAFSSPAFSVSPKRTVKHVNWTKRMIGRCRWRKFIKDVWCFLHAVFSSSYVTFRSL